ncbi:MAG TPA: molybdopterin cofactor-binding domain-containing protein [Terriglobales bacterium]|nr:molybdopterin cofactor-binding domain-containing protein [Terriglobales bacterium]
MSDNSIVGKPAAFIDAAQKTTGSGHYTDDISLPGTLAAKILHSPHAHARILHVDTSNAETLDGVVAVLTGADCPTPYGILPIGHDETALAIDKVRYVGDNVACVVATHEAVAERALDLITVNYQSLPAYFDPEQSMQATAELIHADKPRNIEKEYHHVFGDPDTAFASSDLVHEARYIANEVTHAAMEPHSTLAAFDLDPHSGDLGRLTVWSSTQVPYYLQHKLSLVLGLPMSQIRVIKPLVGGGFGAKSEVNPLEIIAAVAARKAKAPVKITYTREEVFWAHRGRPRTIVDLKIGAKNDGRITAVSARVVQDGGAYCSYGPVSLLYSGALLHAIYDLHHVRFDGFRVLTNKPACGAMRGHGTVNVRFAFESALDEIAAKLKIDPAVIRTRNLLKGPTVTGNGLRVQSYGLPQCIEKVVERSQWKFRKGKLGRGRGLGLACSHYVSGAANPILRSDAPQSTVEVKLERDGSVVVFTGAAEIGQGSDTVIAQIVAEVLGCRLDRVKIVSADTDLTPVDLGSYSSRVTLMTGNAALHAAESVRNQLIAAAAGFFSCDADEILLGSETLYRRGSERMMEIEKSQRVRAASAPALAHRGSLEQIFGQEKKKQWLAFDEAIELAIAKFGALRGIGWYSPPPDSRGAMFKGAGVGPAPAYSYAAQVAEVSVDDDTGQVTVHKIWAAHDCGRALNPLGVEGQIIGSVSMGLGQALQEEIAWNAGRAMNPGLLNYATPGAIESPVVEPFIVESHEPEGPFGAKEAGEGSLAATIPAISNAIFDAVGVRLLEAPFTPERVLAALRAQKGMKRRDLTEGVDPTAPKNFREHGAKPEGTR